MKRLSGNKKIKTAIFISGRGSNLKKLISFSKTKKSPIKINIIVSNNKFAKGLIYATKNKIKKKIIISNRKFFNDIDFCKFLNNNNFKLICLAGFMKIISKNFIKQFKGNIINIHPSLLPNYKGLNTHERVIQNKEKYSGCTVHFVNSRIDSGKIILQTKVKISKNETPKTLSNKILIQEHKLYPKAIQKIFNL